MTQINKQLVESCDFRVSRQTELAQKEIYALYVLKDFHNKGIGRALITAAFDLLQKNKIGDCIVVAFAENTQALIFYERLGFKFKHLKETLIENKLYLEKILYCTLPPKNILEAKI